jgi:hypothetical protein
MVWGYELDGYDHKHAVEAVDLNAILELWF